MDGCPCQLKRSMQHHPTRGWSQWVDARIELCQRARLDRSHHRRPLEQVLHCSSRSAHESVHASSSVAVGLSQPHGRRWNWSPHQDRNRSKAAAWYGTGAESAECPTTQRLESDQSMESHTGASTPGASCSPLADLLVLPGASFSAHPVAGTTTPPAGALPVHRSLPATRPDNANRKPAGRYREWTSCDRWPLLRSSPDSGRG
jgi:hypothetical protein